jgi:hypothetical protein
MDHWTYIVPLVLAAIILRRAMRGQKPRTVRMQRLWIFPALLLLVTWMSLGREGFPGFLLTLVFMAVALAGGAIGWFRVHTLEFSLDKESGKVSARATQLGALLIVGLIGLRFLADYAIKQFGLNAGGNVVHASDATLVFTTSMLVARSVHTWIRARALIAAHKQGAISSLAQSGIPSPPLSGGEGSA